MVAPFGFLSSIPEAWKVAGVTVAIFLGGLGVGATAYGWARIPQKLTDLELRATVLERDHETVRGELRQVRLLIEQQLCLAVAEKQRTPWENCIVSPSMHTR